MSQLVLQFSFSQPSDFDRLVAFEEVLLEATELGAAVDGHDAGSGEMNIFLHSQDPNVTLERCLALMSSTTLQLRGAGMRELEVENYTRVWPIGSSEPFFVQ